MASLLPPGRMENRQLYQQQRGTTAGNNHSRSGNNSNSNGNNSSSNVGAGGSNKRSRLVMSAANSRRRYVRTSEDADTCPVAGVGAWHSLFTNRHCYCSSLKSLFDYPVKIQDSAVLVCSCAAIRLAFRKLISERSLLVLRDPHEYFANHSVELSIPVYDSFHEFLTGAPSRPHGILVMVTSILIEMNMYIFIMPLNLKSQSLYRTKSVLVRCVRCVTPGRMISIFLKLYFERRTSEPLQKLSGMIWPHVKIIARKALLGAICTSESLQEFT